MKSIDYKNKVITMFKGSQTNGTQLFDLVNSERRFNEKSQSFEQPYESQNTKLYQEGSINLGATERVYYFTQAVLKEGWKLVEEVVEESKNDI